MPEPTTLADLLASARAGDATQRDRLFAACRAYLLVAAQAHGAGGVQSKFAGSDLVQQTLLEAHRDFHRFQGQPSGGWRGWLKRIMAHNPAAAARRYRGT